MEGIVQIKQIETFYLSSNFIGYLTDDLAIQFSGQLKQLINLKTLDLSDNQFSKLGVVGANAIFSSFAYITRLENLILRGNDLGLNTDIIRELASSLTHLPNLFEIDLSNNYLDSNDVDGFVLLAKGLSYLTQLSILSLNFNEIGKVSDRGTVSLGNSLAYLSNLEYLDLSVNKIGSTSDEGTLALGNALLYNASKIHSIDLSFNCLGCVGYDGVRMIVKAAIKLNLNSQQVRLKNNNNVTKSAIFDITIADQVRQLKVVCQDQLCHADYYSDGLYPIPSSAANLETSSWCVKWLKIMSTLVNTKWNMLTQEPTNFLGYLFSSSAKSLPSSYSIATNTKYRFEQDGMNSSGTNFTVPNLVLYRVLWQMAKNTYNYFSRKLSSTDEIKEDFEFSPDTYNAELVLLNNRIQRLELPQNHYLLWYLEDLSDDIKSVSCANDIISLEENFEDVTNEIWQFEWKNSFNFEINKDNNVAESIVTTKKAYFTEIRNENFKDGENKIGHLCKMVDTERYLNFSSNKNLFFTPDINYHEENNYNSINTKTKILV